MNEKAFERKKEHLLQFINKNIDKSSLNNSDKISLIRLRSILDKYKYENRLEMKGLVSRVIIDSLELKGSFAKKFFKFDERIS